MKAGVANAANLWLTERQRELDEHWETVGWASRQVLARHRLELQGLHRLLRIQAPALLNRQKQAIREIKTALIRSGNFAVEQTTRELRHSQQRIQRSATQQLAERSTLLAHYRRTLNAIDPERTLARGFMLLEKDGRIISRVADVQEGERLQVKAGDGALDVTVNRVTSRSSSS
jgi:exodeoxyribonuclease VII large subunit